MSGAAAPSPVRGPEAPDELLDIAAFRCPGATFQCWLVSDGCNEIGLAAQRYEWRSLEGMRCASRNAATRLYWARVGHKLIGDRYLTLFIALHAAAAAPLPNGG